MILLYKQWNYLDILKIRIKPGHDGESHRLDKSSQVRPGTVLPWLSMAQNLRRYHFAAEVHGALVLGA